MRVVPPLPGPLVALVDENGMATREWYNSIDLTNKMLLNRLPVTGTSSFSATTTASVTFTTAEISADYNIFPSAPDSKTYWASSKTVSGFTLNASSAVTATVAWQLLRA